MESEIYLSVVVPAYNEESRIGANIPIIEEYLRTLGRSYEIILVDDGSSDSTLDIMNDHASDTVRVFQHKPNFGKGYTVRQGMLETRGEFVMFTDVDLSAPITELPKLFAAMGDGYDVAIGSRAVRGAVRLIHQSSYRELGGKALNLLIQALAVPGIKDTQCGFKLFKGDVAREVFAKCILNGWGFDVEALYLARKMGYRVAETPVLWSHAEGSKIHPLQAGLQVTKDLIRIRLHRYSL